MCDIEELLTMLIEVGISISGRQTSTLSISRSFVKGIKSDNHGPRGGGGGWFPTECLSAFQPLRFLLWGGSATGSNGLTLWVRSLRVYVVSHDVGARLGPGIPGTGSIVGTEQTFYKTHPSPFRRTFRLLFLASKTRSDRKYSL